MPRRPAAHAEPQTTLDHAQQIARRVAGCYGSLAGSMAVVHYIAEAGLLADTPPPPMVTEYALYQKVGDGDWKCVEYTTTTDKARADRSLDTAENAKHDALEEGFVVKSAADAQRVSARIVELEATQHQIRQRLVTAWSDYSDYA